MAAADGNALQGPRHRADIDLAHVRIVLDLVDLTRGDMLAAGTHAPLRCHDALQVAVSLRLGVDEIVTYDAELAEAARAAGLSAVAPRL